MRHALLLATVLLSGCKLGGLAANLVAPVVSITPARPTTTDPLHVVLVNVEDQSVLDPADYDITWLKDGDVVGGLAAPDVPADLTERDQVWTVTVVPKGKQNRVVPGTATVAILNAVPVVEDLHITPDPATMAAPLVAVAHIEDPDGDRVDVTYVWKVGGEVVEDATDDTLDHGYVRDDRVKVELSVSDRRDQPVETQASVVIANTPPEPPVVTLTSAGLPLADKAPPGRADIVCAIKVVSPDADGEPVTAELSWTRNGMPYNGVVDNPSQIRVKAAAQRQGDTFTCEGVATDGSPTTATATASVAIDSTGFLDDYTHVAISGTFDLVFQSGRGDCGGGNCNCSVTLAGSGELLFGDGIYQVYQGSWTRQSGNCRMVPSTGYDVGSYYLDGFSDYVTTLRMNTTGTRVIGLTISYAPSEYMSLASWSDAQLFSFSMDLSTTAPMTATATSSIVNSLAVVIGEADGPVTITLSP